MTTPIIGKDCDLILLHPDVYDGNPYGFILTPDASNRSSSVSIQREVGLEDETNIYIFFTVVLADDLKNPDGSDHTDGRTTMYSKLQEYLDKLDGLSVITVMGTWMGIGPLGHSATELHMVEGSYVSIKLGNISAYHAPVDPNLVYDSIWQDTPPLEDARTWETSIWR